MILSSNREFFEDTLKKLLTQKSEDYQRFINERKGALREYLEEFGSLESHYNELPEELIHLIQSLPEEYNDTQRWVIALGFSTLDLVAIYNARFQGGYDFTDGSVRKIINGFHFGGNMSEYLEEIKESCPLLLELTVTEYDFILKTVEEIYKEIAIYV